MTLTIFGSLIVDTKQIVSHELRQPFAELLDAQQRVNTNTSRRYVAPAIGQPAETHNQKRTPSRLRMPS